MSAAKILIVEDERIVAFEIRDALQQLGYQIAGSTASGEEAVTLAETVGPDLILMDIFLKGQLDGVQAAEIILSKNSIPIIYLTANTDEETIQRAKRTEPYGYLIKPFEDNELHTAIEMALYRARMQKELRANRKYLAAILQSIGDAVLVTDISGQITYVNQETVNVTGYAEDQCLGKDLVSFFPCFEKVRNNFLAGGRSEPVHTYEAETMEVSITTSAGRTKPVHFRAALVKDERDSVSGVVITFRDVSEQIRARDEINRLTELNNSIVRNMSEGVVVFDPDRIFRFVNPAACRLLGYEEKQLIGKQYHVILPQDQRHLVDAAEEKARQGITSRYEVDLRCQNGEKTRVLASNALLREKGVNAGSIAVFSDITKLKEVEKEIEKRQKYLESVLKNAPNAIITVDENHDVLVWNDGAEKMFGYERAEVIGKNIDSLISSPECREEALGFTNRIRSGDRLWSVETVRYRKDGSPLNVVLSGSPIFVDDRLTGAMAVYTDVTRMKAVEEELKRYAEDLEMAKSAQEQASEQLIELVEEFDIAKRKAEEATRTKSEFLANMSHEIRTPMNGIMGMTDLVLETELTAVQADYLGAVKVSAESLLTIINDILDFSKIEAGRLDFEDIDFSLPACIGDIFQALSFKAESKGVELIFHIQDDVPPGLRGDPGRVRQILTNLLSNAVKFTAEGEVSLKVNLLSRTRDDIELEFSVIDSGIGIPSEKQKIIFDAFTQADGSTTRRYGGTGLGLTISKKLVEMMHGQIRVESPAPLPVPGAGPGSVFHFSAHFRPAEDTPVLPVNSLPADIGRQKILIVDNSRTNLIMLEDITSRWGMVPICCQSAEEALAVLAKEEKKSAVFGLGIVDLDMPEIDGLQLAWAMREDPDCRDIPLIFMVNSSAVEGIEEWSLPGTATAVTKPVRPADLLDKIISVLGSETAPAAGRGRGLTKDDQEFPENVKILIAEDNKVNLKLAETLLTRKKWDVTSVTNGKAAVEMWKNKVFDLILMDVQMPVMDGMEATARIRAAEAETGSRIPIIAMTAHAMKGDMEKCLAGGMDDYVSKPMKASELYAAVSRQYAAGKHESMAVSADKDDEQDHTDAVVDISRAMEAVDGDLDLLHELVEELVAEIPGQLNGIKEVIAEGDAAELERRAHGLKGAVGNFGAERASDLAYELEVFGREGRISEAGDVFIRLEKELGRVKKYFAAPAEEWHQ